MEVIDVVEEADTMDCMEDELVVETDDEVVGDE